MEKPIVYLAGRIRKNGWREDLLGYRAGGLDAWIETEQHLFDPGYTVDCGAFRYGGPFFVSCDHGCAHDGGNHGAVGGGCSQNDSVTPQRIFDVNCRRLASADLVFAWINEVNCHGTLIELGMAHQLKKRVTVAFGDGLSKADARELWMAAMCNSSGETPYLRLLPYAWEQFLHENGLMRQRARLVDPSTFADR